MDAFLDLPRHIGILGPVMNYDHRDYFMSGQDVTDAFTAFAAGLALAVTDADCPAALEAARAARKVITVGRSPDADYRITRIQPALGAWRIVNRQGRTVLALHAPHRGPALWLNASRAAIAALELGAAASVVRDGVTAYRGVSRRLELRHSGNGVLMLDDYAHNPPRSARWPKRCAATIRSAGSSRSSSRASIAAPPCTTPSSVRRSPRSMPACCCRSRQAWAMRPTGSKPTSACCAGRLPGTATAVW